MPVKLDDRPGVCVTKVGGSSLASPERLERVLTFVGDARNEGPLCLVVSAFGDTTDHLVRAFDRARTGEQAGGPPAVDGVLDVARAAARSALAARPSAVEGLEPFLAEIARELRASLARVAALRDGSPRARDEVLAFGERVSAHVIAYVLGARGVPALAVDARTWLFTDDRHGDADALSELTRAAVTRLAPSWLAEGQVAVHTGFIGQTTSGATTTLGRNGSDYTAAVLAAAIDAREVTLLTDVPGVLTADPALVPEAYPVPRLSYREALELSGLGLRMLHPRTVLPLVRSGIVLRVRDSLRPELPGTTVDLAGAGDQRHPTCLVSLENLALLDVEGSFSSRDAHLSSRVLARLAQAGVDVWLAAPAPRENGLSVVVRSEARDAAKGLVDAELARELGEGTIEPIRVHEPVSIVTLVAEAMGRTGNVAGRFFSALGGVGVNVRAASQAATSRAISCVVDAADTATAVRALHAATHLAAERVSLLLLGKGTVGGSLLAQLARARGSLPSVHAVDVRVVGAVDSRASIFEEHGIAAEEVRAKLTRATSREPLDALLDRLKRLPSPVLVDCTASDGMEQVYRASFARGIHVVTANKKPLAVAGAAREQLFRSHRAAHRAFRYETTVGASLPIVETLQNLVRTGDRVSRIEGSLSGTLGYLSNELSRGVKLSAAVRAARAQGYTEPHPRDDLAGTDVARKALILARELGLELELDAIVVEPFVPRALFVHDSVDAFLSALEAHDVAFAAYVGGLRARGEVLRYLATIDPHGEGGPRVMVGPVAVSQDHPAAGLRGTEALVSFTTERYAEYPLVVRGAGAGGAVTAAGVLADILAISRARRGA